MWCGSPLRATPDRLQNLKSQGLHQPTCTQSNYSTKELQVPLANNSSKPPPRHSEDKSKTNQYYENETQE